MTEAGHGDDDGHPTPLGDDEGGPTSSVDDPVAEAVRAALDRVIRGLRPHIEIVDEVAVASFEPEPEHRGRPGWLHGGLAATVLDHVCAGAAASALGRPVVTGRLDLRYPRPVPIDAGPYRIEARPEPARGRMVRVEGAILDRSGRRLVEARALFVAIDRPG